MGGFRTVSESLDLGQAAADALREVGNIGAAHAATALSEILNQPVGMQVPGVELVPFDDITEVVGGPEALVAGVFLRVQGDVPGNMFFIQSVDGARKLLSGLLPREPEGFDFSELELSALSEMGNIMAATYLSSLMDFTHLTLTPSVPLVAVDMAQAILSVGLLQGEHMGNYALVIHTTIQHRRNRESGHFFLLPDPGAENVLLKSLGIEGSA